MIRCFISVKFLLIRIITVNFFFVNFGEHTRNLLLKKCLQSLLRFLVQLIFFAKLGSQICCSIPIIDYNRLKFVLAKIDFNLEQRRIFVIIFIKSLSTLFALTFFLTNNFFQTLLIFSDFLFRDIFIMG